MCALFGWMDYAGKVPHKVLVRLTQALANAAEERGTDASGISYVKDRHMTIYKRPKPAHKMRFHVPDGTSAVMGHTRFTTQGDQRHNYNNHPFRGFAGCEFSFAHNGVLYNDKELRRMKKLPATKIETDSYVGVQLIEQNGDLSFDSLRNMAEDVSGNFTFTILDAENSLYIIKGSSPMYLIHFEMLGLYVYASTHSIMEAALKSCGLHRCQYDVIEAEHGDILKIDCYGKITRDQFHASPYDSFYSSWCYSMFDKKAESETELDLIMEMCSCFGVDPEEIMELIDCGYTYDEIELFLMEPEGFCETLNERCCF